MLEKNITVSYEERTFEETLKKGFIKLKKERHSLIYYFLEENINLIMLLLIIFVIYLIFFVM